MSIGDRLKELRGAENQTRLGARFGKARNTILRYEAGQNPLDTDFVEALCRKMNVSPTWLLLGEGPKELRPHEVDAHVDTMLEIEGDQEAARRNRLKVNETGDILRRSREEAEAQAGKIAADLGLDKAKAEHLRHPLQTAIFGRLQAEWQRDKAWDKTAGTGDPDPSLGECMELLIKIYKSEDSVLTRAITANLQAFSTAIDDRHRADQAIKMMARMEERITALEKRNAAQEERLKEAEQARETERAELKRANTGK